MSEGLKLITNKENVPTYSEEELIWAALAQHGVIRRRGSSSALGPEGRNGKPVTIKRRTQTERQAAGQKLINNGYESLERQRKENPVAFAFGRLIRRII